MGGDEDDLVAFSRQLGDHVVELDAIRHEFPAHVDEIAAGDLEPMARDRNAPWPMRSNSAISPSVTARICGLSTWRLMPTAPGRPSMPATKRSTCSNRCSVIVPASDREFLGRKRGVGARTPEPANAGAATRRNSSVGSAEQLEIVTVPSPTWNSSIV